MNKTILHYSVLLYLLSVNLLHAQLVSEDWQLVSLGEGIGSHLIETIDLNNDNIDEIILVGQNGGIKLEYNYNKYMITGYTDIHNNHSAYHSGDITCATLYNDGTNFKLLMIALDGLAQIYDANSFELLFEYKIDKIDSRVPNSCQVVDLDFDGNMEIIVIGSDFLTILNETNFEELYFSEQMGSIRRSIGGDYLEVGNIDSDKNPEIICGDGSIFDFHKLEIENKFDLKYPYYVSDVTLIDINNDGLKEMLFYSNYKITALSSNLTDTLFQIETGRVTSIKYENIDDDIENELVVGVQDGINIYDLNPLQLKTELSGHTRECVSNFAMGDVDGDGDTEVVFGIGVCSTGKDHLLITNFNTNELEWKNTELYGFFNVSTYSKTPDRIYCSSSHFLFEFSNLSDSISFLYPDMNNSYLHTHDIFSFEEPNDSILIVGNSEYFDIIDLKLMSSRKILVQDGYSKRVYTLIAEDVDLDDSIEVVIGTRSGYLIGYNLISANKEFLIPSEKTKVSTIYDIVLGGIQKQDKNNIYFSGTSYTDGGNTLIGVVGCLDLSTLTIEWTKVIGETYTANLTLYDLDQDGINELYVGTNDKKVIQFDLTNSEFTTFYNADFSISNVEFKNIDSHPDIEMILFGEKLAVYDIKNFNEKFSSKNFSSNHAFNDLLINDYDNDGFMNLVVSNYFGIFAFKSLEKVNNETSISSGETISNRFYLHQNYPNPFNPITKIRYGIPHFSNVKISIYDILGNLASILINKPHKSGEYEIEFDGSKLSSGVYYYRLISDNTVITNKLLLLK